MVVTGYILPGITSLNEIEEVLAKIKKKIDKIAKEEYGKLLGEETALLCDNISLNILQRNDNVPLIYVARDKVDEKIKKMNLMGASFKYNFTVYIHVMQYEGDTYFKVTCLNKAFLKAFHLSVLKDFSLNESECRDESNHKTIVWEKLHAVYANSSPLTVNFTPSVEYDREKVVFPSIKERASMHARHSILNRLLNQLGGGQQIPPYLLMPYMDQALERLTTDSELSFELGQKTIHLGQVFLDLDKQTELIFGKEATQERK